MRKKICIWCLMLFLLPSMVLAAKMQGHIEESDFSCNGLMLGAAEGEVKNVLGEPLYDKQMLVMGRIVLYYIYDDFDIGVSKDHHVVDIKFTNKNYRVRDDIRYGATPYKIQATYGKSSHTSLDGVTYYIYQRQNHPKDRLLLEMDSETDSLKSMRITSLPLTDEEAGDLTDEESSESDLDNALPDEKADRSPLSWTKHGDARGESE